MRVLRSASTLLLAALALGAGAVGVKPQSVEELMNPLLSPDLALWLVGPIAEIATREEIQGYQRLSSDEQARAFIEQFWKQRDPDPAYARNALRERFDERVAEADRRFAEAGLPGRRTDRGIVFVLYGEPGKERFDVSDHPDDPPILIWEYDAKVGKGLDGKRPDRTYRFIRRQDLTTFYTPNRRPPRPRVGRPPF